MVTCQEQGKCLRFCDDDVNIFLNVEILIDLRTFILTNCEFRKFTDQNRKVKNV